MANGKYNSVGADPCVRPSKGPYLPYLKPLIGSTHGSTPTNSFEFCDLTFEFIFRVYSFFIRVNSRLYQFACCATINTNDL